MTQVSDGEAHAVQTLGMINQSLQIPTDLELGVCVKDRDATVVFQNALCVKACGNRIHLICKDGCMDPANSPSGDLSPKEQIRVIPNLITSAGKMSAVVLTTPSTLTSLLCPKK